MELWFLKHMAVFQYKGFDQQGKPVHGVREADSERSLRTALRRDGVLLTEVAEQRSARKQTNGHSTAASWRDNLALRIESIGDASPQNISVFTRQLATLIKAGIQLSEALGALLEQSERPGFKRMLADVRTQVNEGKPLSLALGQHPRFFGNLYVRMVSVGEASGNLDGVLASLANLLDEQNRLRSKVTSALLYPIVMLSVVGVVMIILMTTVVPQITELFKDNGKVLPWNTRLLIASSEIISDYFWLFIPLIVLICYGFVKWKNSRKGQVLWDRFKLRLWVVGPLTQMIALGRFASASATMLHAALPLLQTLEVVETVLGNAVLAKVISNARESIREGESIAQTLKKSGRFPPLLCHMIAVGERTGQLEAMLENVALAYQSEVETKLARLTALMEPLMIVVMGLSVGFIVLSVLGPIQQMNQAF